MWPPGYSHDEVVKYGVFGLAIREAERVERTGRVAAEGRGPDRERTRTPECQRAEKGFSGSSRSLALVADGGGADGGTSFMECIDERSSLWTD